jgi:hypothetical protein
MRTRLPSSDKVVVKIILVKEQRQGETKWCDLLETLARVEGYNETHPSPTYFFVFVVLNNGIEVPHYRPIIGELEKAPFSI